MPAGPVSGAKPRYGASLRWSARRAVVWPLRPIAGTTAIGLIAGLTMRTGMFQLFYSVFGGAGRPRGRWSESVIAAAIEHAVEGTVPRLRFLRGYRKRLRASVIHAMEHTAMLAAGIPGPLPMGPTAYRTEPRLTTVFATAAEMLDLFGGSAVASGLCHNRHGTDGRVTVLLLAERSDKHILGIDLVGDQLRREVKQTVVNFWLFGISVGHIAF